MSTNKGVNEMEGIKFISIPGIPPDSLIFLTEQRLQEEIARLCGAPEKILKETKTNVVKEATCPKPPSPPQSK